MSQVSVDLSSPSPYIEKDTRLHRFKRRLTYAFAFRLIRKFSPSLNKVRLLEIGTGSGFFLSFCKDVFDDPTLYGIEYDERLLKVTQARAPFAISQQGNAESFDLGTQRFDIIVSFQVIEHLYDPKAMLAKVWEYLAPGGVFLVTSPNTDGFGARWMGSSWHGYRDDHVSLKSVDEWTTLITSMGFTELYSGSTFFSGVPWLNRLPLGLVNWMLLLVFGSLRWKKGESFVGIFRRPQIES